MVGSGDDPSDCIKGDNDGGSGVIVGKLKQSVCRRKYYLRIVKNLII